MSKIFCPECQTHIEVSQFAHDLRFHLEKLLKQREERLTEQKQSHYSAFFPLSERGSAGSARISREQERNYLSQRERGVGSHPDQLFRDNGRFGSSVEHDRYGDDDFE
ncbi:hypothetical protein [Deinococcus budaensis]|uniref:Uncharacterized protein n=1 Tax=Deinococcus budaensis TaxID=1665626 RepID=A0A7W8GBT7_9DEIO|nr:hypothetical protein [Deinococcus budaensis]MBB5232689.1 hypothetical protein [Deinococcus budaensis]